MIPALGFSGAAQANNPLAEYARARVADASGQIGLAARGYASALSDAPFDETLAARAYRRAVAAGEKTLALRAAQSLQNASTLPPDGEFLFLIEALEEDDWAESRRIVDRIEEQGLFASLAPVLRAWIAFSADDADPLEILDAESDGGMAAAYIREHRALLLLAMRRYDEGIAATLTLSELGPPRFLRLRLAAAARLASGRRRDDDALALLPGQSRAEIAARAVIERRRSIPGAVDSAADGIGELFVRLAGEINRQNASSLALTISRFATFLAPDNSVGWFVTSSILTQAGQRDAALDVLGNVHPRDPFYSDVQDMRVQLLEDTDDPEAALELARSRADSRDATPADWQRYGERYAVLQRFNEAAEAYGRAVELAGKDAPWTALLLYGGALLDAERWEESRPVLERVVELAPDQAVALNYLGYALLERREDLDHAEALITRASQLNPTSPSIADSLGWVYFVQGALDRAIPMLERASVGEATEPTINEHLGDAYWTVGRRRDARYAWQAALVSAEADAVDRIRAKIDIGLTVETASP